MEQRFEFLEHTADIKFKAYGITLNETFENAVMAFVNYIGNGHRIHSKNSKKINMDGTDKKNLLYKFMDELVYLLDHGFVVGKAIVEIDGTNLKAELFGDNVKNYKGLEYIKAATYSEMYIRKKNLGWELQIVLDI